MEFVKMYEKLRFLEGLAAGIDNGSVHTLRQKLFLEKLDEIRELVIKLRKNANAENTNESP